MNWSTGLGPIDRLVNTVNILTFQIFAHFLVFLSSFTLFSWNPQFFMPNAKWIFIFGRNLTII